MQGYAARSSDVSMADAVRSSPVVLDAGSEQELPEECGPASEKESRGRRWAKKEQSNSAN